ncbi:hypothetical protein DICVIV_06263 [Dictyocaulus viviparus]|uniref:Uncharacterized protein n=1 Tax=Dictyocaulus viviparus TaxID=29172 RepID=A0A0D8XSM7_DICVI|nr:hypothetical protein DICVIV_06263 [Dictyocaulus viviparus]
MIQKGYGVMKAPVITIDRHDVGTIQRSVSKSYVINRTMRFCDSMFASVHFFTDSFEARGCSSSRYDLSSRTTIESCYQALEMCKGKGECYTCDNNHMCNITIGSASPLVLVSIVVLAAHTDIIPVILIMFNMNK